MEDTTAENKYIKFLTRYGHFLWIAGLTFIFITVCSTCSFIYPMNEWVDSNVYFTIGKAMLGGKVLYRDIFDHKGMYLFVMHSFAYLISHRTFIGVYLLELVFAFIFIYAEYRILLLYIEKRYALICLPLLAFASYGAYAFVYGDSAEEFCLPFMAVSLLHILQYVKGGRLSLVKYGAAGAFTAWTLWVKFSLCGFYLGWALLVLIFELKDKNYKHLFAGIGVFFAALAVASIPVFVYFGVNGALGDMWEVYFYDNLFVYTSGTSGQVVGFVRKVFLPVWSFIRSIFYGLTFYISVLPGFVYLALSKDINRREKAAIFTIYGVMNFLMFAGGRGGKYVGLPVNIFSYLGIVALCRVKFTAKMWEKLFKKFYVVAGVCIIVLSGLSIAVNPVRYMVFQKKSSRVRYQFAEIIEKKPSSSILNFGGLDQGLHTLTDTYPEFKYYFKPNMALPVFMETQSKWVAEGKADYVVCTSPLHEIMQDHLPDVDVYEKYELLKEGRQFTDSGTVTLYLYGSKEFLK